MVTVPQFAGNPDIFAFDDSICNFRIYSFADLFGNLNINLWFIDLWIGRLPHFRSHTQTKKMKEESDSLYKIHSTQ